MITAREEFAKRLNKALDEAGVAPKHQGRQTETAKLFGVTQGSSRKWLVGDAYPDVQKIREIANKLKVRVEWLLYGDGPMRKTGVDVSNISITPEIDDVLLESIIVMVEETLAKEKRQDVSAKTRARLICGAYRNSRNADTASLNNAISIAINMLGD
jgi:hypothetical protein